MAKTTPLIDNWTLGRQSDVPINLMKPNASVTLQNFIPNILGHPLVKRAPWSYTYTANPTFTTVSATTTKITGTNFAHYEGGEQFLIFVDQAGHILKETLAGVLSVASATGVGGTGQNAPSVMHLNNLVLPTANSADIGLVDHNGAFTLASASYSTPGGSAVASWDAYLLVADEQNILYFSDPGVLDFDNGSSWIFKQIDSIQGVFPLANTILVFGKKRFDMLTGTTPPPNNDLAFRSGFPYGMCSYTAGKVWNGYVIFANERGIFKTDGTGVADITTRCGLSTAWRNDMQSFTTGWNCAMGLYQNYAIVTVTNASQVEQFTYVFDLSTEPEVGFNMKGFPSVMYAEVALGALASTVISEQDLIFGLSASPQAGRFQPCVSLGTTGGKDANGVAIEYEWISAMNMLGDLGNKRVKRAYLSYDYRLDSPYTEAPTIEYRMGNTPFTSTSWTSLTMPAAGAGRQPLFVNDRGRWVQFRLHGGTAAGTNALALYGLEVEGHENERSKVSSR